MLNASALLTLLPGLGLGRRLRAAGAAAKEARLLLSFARHVARESVAAAFLGTEREHYEAYRAAQLAEMWARFIATGHRHRAGWRAERLDHWRSAMMIASNPLLLWQYVQRSYAQAREKGEN